VRRRLLILFFVAAFGVTFAASSGADHRRLPEVIELPAGFQPEGIARGRGATFYAGSIPTGAVLRGNFRTATTSPLVPAQPGRAAIGVAFDRRGDRLFVAGGPTGAAFVYDASTGADIGTFELTSASSTFVNDVVVTRRAAWFTDSFNQVLYRIPIARDGSLGSAETVPLTGDIVFRPNEFNANGIDSRRNGKTLVIVQSITGLLFSVDAATGVTREIDLGDDDVRNGDGILLQGRKLFVVQNVLNRVAVVKLKCGFRKGDVVRHITDDDLDVPTTIDKFAGRLWAVNARFGVDSPETASYQIVQLRRRSGHH
jgi:hypothetical protein